MELQDLLKKPLPQIPLEISTALSKNAITPISFECKNDILSSAKLQNEVGYPPKLYAVMSVLSTI